MSLRAASIYQIKQHKVAALIFYGIYAATFFANLCMTGIFNRSDGGTSYSYISSYEFSTALFLFIFGLCSFKENFGMMIQNAVSRKTLIKSRIITTVSTCAVFAVVDVAFFFLFKLLVSSFNNLDYMGSYELSFGTRAAGLGIAALIFEMFLYNICLFIMMMSIGYFITILYYRLNTIGKVVVSVAVPMAFSYITTSQLAVFVKLKSFLYSLTGASSGNPYIPMASFLVGAVVVTAAAWLMIRRAVVKES